MSLAGLSLIAACWRSPNAERFIGRGPLFVAATIPVLAILGLSVMGAVDAVVKLTVA